MIGIIGGTSLQYLDDLVIEKKEVIRTPFGIPSAPIIRGNLYNQPVAFLARHGLQHTIPPHLINYRANIWALHHIGCCEVLAFSAMCSLSKQINLGEIIIPNQLIDYTWDRKATFFNSQINTIRYTEFADPYSETIRQRLIAVAKSQPCGYQDKATYGIMQGPRYETRAEIRRYQNDGCDVLGMTGMPEAALAQEIQLAYAVCGLVTNVSSGDENVPRKALANSKENSNKVFKQFLSEVIASLPVE